MCALQLGMLFSSDWNKATTLVIHDLMTHCLDVRLDVSSVREAVEGFCGLHGFPALPTLCEQAVQRGQRLSKKATDNMSKRRHLPWRIQALATDRCWPLKTAVAVYDLVMQRHKLSLVELRDAMRLSSPVPHAAAKGGKPAQSQHVNRSPG